MIQMCTVWCLYSELGGWAYLGNKLGMYTYVGLGQRLVAKEISGAP